MTWVLRLIVRVAMLLVEIRSDLIALRVEILLRQLLRLVVGMCIMTPVHGLLLAVLTPVDDAWLFCLVVRVEIWLVAVGMLLIRRSTEVP